MEMREEISETEFDFVPHLKYLSLENET